MTTDKQWTKEKGAAGNTAASPAPLLGRASAPAGGEGGGGMDMASMYMSGGGGGMMPGMGMAGGAGYPGGPGGGGKMSEMIMGGYGGSGMGGQMGGVDATKNMTYLTRTDFLIQFVWQPPTTETPAQAYEEIVKAIREAETNEKNKGAVKIPTEAELEQESLKKSKEVIEEVKKVTEAISKAQQDASKGAAPAGKSAASDPGAPAAKGAAAPAAVPDPGAPAKKQ
jgi:hypothetical protein